MHEVSTKKTGGHLIMDDTPKLHVRLVGRDGRRRYDPASRDQLVAACLEPGVSVSRLAREHGVNTNLVRKWIKKARGKRPLPLVSGSDLLPKPGPLGKLGRASKLSALLPNGINLSVESDDENGLIAIIGALSHVQTGR